MVIAKLRNLFRSSEGDGKDALASLILAAKDDATLKAQLLALLRLPQSQREPVVHTAVGEMRLRGESAETQNAFLILATEEGARTALQLLNAPDTMRARPKDRPASRER